MISPYVRRRRLATELVTAREGAGLTQAQLAKKVGFDRAKIVRLEGAKARPDLNDIMAILEALGVKGERWTKITDIAGDAAVRGWWASQPMDQRQAVYADLEAGATSIREYQPTIVPGLLQTEAYTRALNDFDDLTLAGAAPASQEAIIRARAGRQRMLRRPDGPRYEVILDEVAVRRLTVPRSILAEQLRSLTTVGHAAVQVLPVSVEIEAYSVPRGAFSLYTYPDPGDPVVAAVDTVTADLALTEESEVRPYEQLFERLRKAALSERDSASLIAEAADEIERITS